MNPHCQTLRTEFNLELIPQADRSESQCVGKVALRVLFDAEESALLRYAHSLTRRRAVAEEIVQEAFLQLHAHWDEVDAPKAWLYRSVRNRAYNHIRDNKREILTCDERNVQTTDAQHDTPEKAFQRMESVEMLREVVEGLDAEDRQLVRLKYFENLSYRDMSQQTGLSVSNVGYRLHHILKGLASKLSQLGIDALS